MITRLLIEDYGLIARAEIELAAGPTMFTGETGSGKTMVLGAIAFVLGERAGADVVRRSAKRATVTLNFDAGPALRSRLEADGFELDSAEDAILAREMTEAGKSTLRLNGRQTTAGYIREVAAEVADIIGQHEAQRLLAANCHTQILDRFGGSELIAARTNVAQAHAAVEAISAELRLLSDREGKAQAEFEFAQFAFDEIHAAALEAGEDQLLDERRRYLDNIERITSALKMAHDALARDDGANDSLGEAAAALAGIAPIERELGAMADAAASLQDQAGELAVRISRKLDQTEFDAAELETINARLDLLERLKKKYGGSIEAIIESGERYRRTIDSFATRDQRRMELEAQQRACTGMLELAAQKLTTLRSAAAERLRARVQAEFPDLALPAGKFKAEFTRLPSITAEGAESIEFLFTANAGEPLRPLVKVASGGELSRVLLALILAVMQTREPTALVFDEIDAGIGGATAAAVGARLAKLGKVTQVICVTHLAQIASWAERHYVLEKEEKGSKTTIVVHEAAKRTERAGELARMLSGGAEGVALKHAEALLQAATQGDV
ncbi:MAG: DNA repair protein RecN [Candidatus Eremiobacteraeota bacterium]|nr:DNA repair protein RecN [Candidatus Eremiobacteraeota bacterium]